MPVATLTTVHGHVVRVYAVLPGDVAHVDGYADCTVNDGAHVTLPLDMIEKV